MPAPARDDDVLRRVDAAPPAWVVTPTRRLARTLALRVAELRAEDGRRVADTPPIFALDDWLRRLGRVVLAQEVAEGRGPGRVLLSRHAEKVLWERVILSTPGDLPKELLDVAALADTALEAWSRIVWWGEPSWNGPMIEDVERFRDWLPVFREKLRAGRFVTDAQLAGLVSDAIRRGALDPSLPGEAVAPGFEKSDPKLALLLDALRERGVRVGDHLNDAPRAPAPLQVWTASSSAAEVRTVAARIRARLLAQPDLRVAVLAPDPSSYGRRLERIFEEELDPAGVLDVGAGSARRFDFAEAPALADYPLVAGALDLLGLDGPTVAFETASALLLSEYPRPSGVDDDEQERRRVLRGRVEAELRRRRSAVLRVAGTAESLAVRLRTAGLPDMASSFEGLADRVARDTATRRAPGAWRREWHDRLRLLGWPGPLRGDVEGFVFRRWNEAMDAFAALEAVEPSMEAHHALSRLRAICSDTPVQPRSESRGVQVLSLLDAAGLEFDVVFAIGLTATAFPAAPRPNPLLPAAWQRVQAGMPRTSVEGERELAAAVWERVLRSAPEVHAMWATTGDGAEEQTPSAVLAGRAAEPFPVEEATPWWLASAQQGAALQVRPDDVAGPPRVRRGGSAILQQQSDCPFRAFAETRLGARKLDAIVPQPDSARRGTLVHAALAFAYGRIGSSHTLEGLSDENILDEARAAAGNAIEAQAEFFAEAGDLADAMKFWLVDLLAGWMRYERDVRALPWEIADLERNVETRFPADAPDPLVIRFRPDRIDRVEDGALVVLDFKTSTTPKKTSLWNGDRPQDPQLPLYLALLEEQGARIDGIAFANLSARDACMLEGVGAREFSANFRPPGRADRRGPAEYEAKAAEWRTTVRTLAEGFLAGDVRVDPRRPEVCRSCGSQALCRIAEIGPADEDDEAGEGDE